MEEEEHRKRRRLNIDYSKCVVCQKDNRKKKIVQSKSPEAVDKLVKAIKKRFEYSDTEIYNCFYRLNGLSQMLLFENSVYHSECYKKVTNSTHIERLVKRQEINPIAQTPTESDESLQADSEETKRQEINGAKSLRSKFEAYNKNYCIICQQEGGTLHKVQVFDVGKRMLDVAKELLDQSFYIRMNSIPSPSDAVANDVQYHLKCWVMAQRSAQKGASDDIQVLDEIDRVIADIEIIELVKLNSSGETNDVLDMNNINKTYNNLFGNDEGEEINYKRYLKTLLKDNIPGLIFSRPPCRRYSEQLCSSNFQGKAVDAFNNGSDNYTSIFQAARVIRKEVLQHRNWKFSGNFSDFDLPISLCALLKWIITGPKTNIDTSLKKRSVDTQIDNISQIIVQATKSKRQMTYKGSTDANFRDVVETPFSVGLGLHLHKETRNKKLIDCISDLGLSISYDKVMKIENGLGNAVVNNMETNQGVFVPPNLEIGKPLHFAIDNIDFKNDTADGKFEFHGTTLVAFQNKAEKRNKLINLTPCRTFTFEHNPCIPEDTFSKPNPPNETFPNYEASRSLTDLSSVCNADRLWGIFQVVKKENICPLPTWRAFNSLIASQPTITTCQGLPLYPGSPTDWSNLYTALKLAQGINVAITGNKKTIVTLDLQLYSKCMQMREKDEIKNNFIFRLGELHVVFAFLKVIGKYVLGSGIEQVLVEAGVYGPTTLGQILEGKHMKRGMEAHMITYLSLYKIYLDNVLELHPDVRSKISDKAVLLSADVDKELKRTSFHEVITDFTNDGTLELFTKFDETLKQGSLFLRNYMVMYEVLLQFVRANREGNWHLHLSSLDAMIPYLFAHDQINYARHAPLYLATMKELEHTDVDNWLYLKANFSVNKSGIPFCSIGSDHALEQENKVMKVSGGVKGLTQNACALYRFCLIAPSLNALSKAFCEKNNVEGSQRTKHYQLTGSTNGRIASNIQKVVEVFGMFDIDFKESSCVCNIVSKAVLPDDAASELLNHYRVGIELYNSFTDDRLQGDTSVWSPMKKRNLKTFCSQAKSIKTKVGEKVIQLKEERTLLSRFLITARKRPDLDLEASIGNYEFSVVPKSMFTLDGQPLLSSDKAKILHAVENMLDDEAQREIAPIFTAPVIIIDGMALVNKVHKDVNVKTWKHFAEQFVSLLRKVSKNSSEIRLVFDRYIQQSLKSRTRKKRTSGNEVKYKISSNSNISNKSIKQLLGHIETKQALTEYLAEYTKDALKDTIWFAVTFSKQTETNIPDFPDEFRSHDHEEADTLLVWHAIDVAKNDPFKECIVLSPDTDVFLLLLHYYQLLPHVTIFRTGRGDQERDISIQGCYEVIGSQRANAILGFHVLTGCDQIGRFSGKAKLTWWREFMKSDDNIFSALSNLGNGEGLPNLFTLENIERFVVNTYGEKKKPSHVTTLVQLRWFLFSKYQYDAAQLPPTTSALKYKIFRSHFVCMVLKRSHLPIQGLPSPENYGWELNGQSLDPIMTDNLPAPIALIELSVCNCKGGCTTKRCKCLKNNFVCTDMCKCEGCKNNDSCDDDYDDHDISDSDTDVEDSI